MKSTRDINPRRTLKKKEKKKVEGQEKAIGQSQDIQAIRTQVAEKRKLMQEQIDELKRMQWHTSRDIEPLQVQAAEEIKHIHEIIRYHSAARRNRFRPDEP
jgi:hypothetical protein